MSGVACCSPSALIMPCRRRVCSLSSVGFGSISKLLFQVSGSSQGRAG
ncbi:hypothetical protein KPSA1_07351 [Pseudomonas syringae pv. actinidiae]|uniref:Uncharacterized protein n=1 Tax=Pseudomonas syringae pv. actinidiae TaxID=103796 RepID=A0A2V0QLY6_PSESF|nr:hypothetical protein KPSA1_07351 [Pseudomonas syringae pv. actinidiae]